MEETTLGETRIRKLPLFSLHWDVLDDELTTGVIVAGTAASLLAVLRLGSEEALRADIFTQSGVFVRSVRPSNFTYASKLCRGGAGWTRDELLVLVTESGHVTLCCGHHESSFELFGVQGLLPTAPVGDSVLIANCSWGGGIVIILKSLFVVVIKSLFLLFGDAPLPRFFLVRPNSSQPSVQFLNQGKPISITNPICLAVSSTPTDGTVVLIGASDGTLMRITATESTSLHLATPVMKLAVSPQSPSSTPTTNMSSRSATPDVQFQQQQSFTNGSSATAPPGTRMWAAGTKTGHILVLSDNLKTKLLDLDTQAQSPPAHLVWMGEDAVVASWPALQSVVVVGPKKDWIKYEFGPVMLIGERDACRIITSTSHEMLQRIPSLVDATFGIGSFAPSAILLDASESLQSDPIRADEALRGLGTDDLMCGIRDCVRAALCEFDLERQQRLMSAASIGKIFLGTSPAEHRRTCMRDFAKAIAALKILNVVRHQDIGIPVSHSELVANTATGSSMEGFASLAIRLAARGNLHYLALKIFKTLSGVALGRNSLTILRAAERKIVENWVLCVIDKRGISDTDVASIIKDVKRIQGLVRFGDVAAELDCRSHGQKRTLAIALLELEPSLGSRVARLLSFGEISTALVAAQKDRELMVLAAKHHLPQSLWQQKKTFRQDYVAAVNRRDLSEVEVALQWLEDSSGDTMFVRSTAREQHRLLNEQGQVRNGQSLFETIASLVQAGKEDRAEKLRKEFRMNDVLYNAAKMTGLSRRPGDFDKLIKFATRLGDGAIVTASRACGNIGDHDRAAALAMFVIDPELRMCELVRYDRWKEVSEAFKAIKDNNRRTGPVAAYLRSVATTLSRQGASGDAEMLLAGMV